MILIEIIIVFKKLICVLSIIRDILIGKVSEKIRMSWTTIREGRVCIDSGIDNPYRKKLK